MSINSLYSKLSTLVETKSLLRQAIIDKGVPVRKNRDTFRDYVTKINNIVQESPHGKNAPYIDDSLVFCEDYSEIQASKLNLASDSSILDMECPFTVELSFVLDSSVELTQSFETFIDFSFVRIGAQRVSEQQLYLMYGEHLSSDWSYTMWLTDNSNPTSDCILSKDQVVTITCVRYSDHALIYKNGELIITSEESFTELFDTAFSIYRPFDADAAGYHSVINTTINNVRIYNKALNENEIYYNYSIDLLNNGNTQYLNTNHIKSGLVYGINPILPLTGINSHDNVSNYNNHFDNLSIPISLQNGFTIEWRGSISDIMSNDNEPYDYTGRLFTFKNSNGSNTFEVCATMDSEDTDIFDISFKASDEYLIDSEDWLEVFSDTLSSIKFSSDFTLSITVSSIAVNVYINGVLEASSSTYQNKFTDANLWKILYLFTNSLESPLQGTDGFLYSLRIYNRVLNEYEINYNYKVDTRSDIKNPDPLYGKAILGELGNMTLNASGVIIPKAFNCSKPFEIVSCFKMKSDENENDKNFALFGSSDASNYSAYPSIEIRPYTNKLWVGVSINPNNWTYTQEVDLSDIPIVYDNNVLNWIKMEYDGDKIYLSHSIDCLSWTRFHTITGIVPYNPVTNDYTLIFGAKLQNSNLTYTYKSNGETSFSFMNSWVKSCNKTIWGREIMGQELYTNNSTVLVPNGDVRYNAGSFIAYPNLDMSDDFEVVVCLAIDKTAMTSGQTYYLAGGITSSTSNFRIYATYYNIGYQIFYGTHTVAEDDVSWENTVSNFIYNEGAQNFLKLKKRDGKVSFYHSLDAINWSLLNEVEINSETFTNLQDDGIRFGNAGSDTSTALPMTNTSFINLHNSYVKVNGEIVWGREIREKAQVYAPEIKRETVLYQPDISGFVSGDTEIYNLGVGNGETQLVNVTKYNDYLCFPKSGESKFDFIANPMAYDKTQISFVVRFDEPSRTWNSIFGIDAEKTNPDKSRTTPNFLYMSLVSATSELVERRGLRIYLYANGIVRSNSDIISNIRNESPYIWIFFNKTLFPVSGWTSDVKFDLKFDNINHTLSIFIDDIEAIVILLFEIYPYDKYPVKAVFGWFDDSNESAANQSLYFKDIEYKIEGSVSKGMIKEVECTSEEYSQLGTHDPNTLYNVTYPDESIKRFLRNEELGGTTTVVKTRKVTLYKPDIASFVSNSGTINNLGSGKPDIYISSEVIKNRGYLKFTNSSYGMMCILTNPRNYDKTRLKFTINFPTPKQETGAWSQIFGCMGDKINQAPESFEGTNLINYMYMALLNNNSGFTGLLFVIKESVTIIRYDNNMISTIDHSQVNRTSICFSTTIFPVTGWNLDKKIVLEFNNIDNIVSIFVDDTEAIVMSISNSTSYNISPVKYSLGAYNEGNTNSMNTGSAIELLMKDIIYEVEGACSADMFDEIDYTPSEYYSLESYDDHRVYNVNYQDGTIRRFLGDEEIGIIRPEPKYNVVSNFYGEYSPIFSASGEVCYKILNTCNNFDTSKTFDIIIAFKLTSSSTHSYGYCLFGTATYNQYYNYPSCEITADNSLWFAMNTPSTSSTWPSNLQLSVSLSSNLMEFGKINYYKFSYVRGNQTLTIYHSLDGETWTSVASKDITSALSGGTLNNDTTYDFCIGGNALSSTIAFPCDDDNHICIDKCKIISNGNIIFGWDSRKVLTGEEIIEEPTVYEVDCTSEVYNSLPLYDPRTIYNVVNQDDSVNKYLGEDLIGGTVDNLGEIVPKNYENETRIFEDRNVIYETKCTSTKYNSMSNHSENVLYSVIQPDNKVYKYLGDHQIGVDKTDIGSIDIANSTSNYIKTSMIIDQTKDFEFVICFTMPSGNHNYNLVGNPDMLGIGATVGNNSSDNTKAEGGFQFFVDSGGWANTTGIMACPSAALIADGVTKNYMKFERKGNYLYASYSLDGKNFILETTQAVPAGTYSTEEPIYFGKVYTNYSETLNLLSFRLSECYLKQNGQIVFGNELKPVNFAGENINISEYALPKSDITILKSIKSTGNSVIPTNIIPDYDWSVFLDAKFENPHLTRDADIVFGILRSDEHFFIAMQQGSGCASYTAASGFAAQSGDTYSIGDETSITRNLGTRQCCIMRRGTNKNCSFGDLSFNMTVRTTDGIPYKPITIMGTINESTETLKPYDHYDTTLYGIQIMDASDKLIHNFVPALSNISKRAGMYDLITETFYQSDKNFDDFEIEYIGDESNNNYYDNIVAPVTFLKSVKSVGNSVVQTDIALEFDWEVHMSVMFSGTRKSTSPTYSFFGVAGSDPWFTAESVSGTSVAFYIGFDNDSNPAITFDGMEPNTIIPIVARRNGDCICGIEYDSISDSVTGNPHSFGAAFFGVSTGSSTVLPFAYYDMTIYNVDIVDSTGSIIHKLVPAENNVGRGGLFDLVTNKFYPADNRYDDLVKDYGSNATRSPYNVYRILNPSEYNQNGIVLSLSDFTNNAEYYTYTLPIASSEGFTFEINLSFNAFENRSGICTAKEQLLFDSRNGSSSDRYSIRIRYDSEGQYAVLGNKNSTFKTSTRYVSDNEVHTYTLIVCANGNTKVYVDGELWDTINSTNLGALYREFYLFTSYDYADGWTFYPTYRTVNRLMIYNRALTEQEILENRKADIINFGE